MKKIGVYVILLAATWAACEKEAFEIAPNANSTRVFTLSTNNGGYATDISDCYGNIVVVNDMLMFSSANDLQETCECLSNKQIQMDSLFIADYGYLDNDTAIKNVADSIGYQEQWVAYKFADHFSIKSYVSVINDAFNQWMIDLTLDTTTAPPNLRVHNMNYAAVLNEFGVVKVNDTLVVNLADSGTVYVLNSDYTTMDSVLNGTYSPSNQNVLKWGQTICIRQGDESSPSIVNINPPFYYKFYIVVGKSAWPSSDCFVTVQSRRWNASLGKYEIWPTQALIRSYGNDRVGSLYDSKCYGYGTNYDVTRSKWGSITTVGVNTSTSHPRLKSGDHKGSVWTSSTYQTLNESFTW